MRASAVSAVPENLGEGLTADQFADMLEFLKNQPAARTAEVRTNANH